MLTNRRDTMTKKRKTFTPEKKVSILRRHLLEKVPVSQVCEENDIQPTQFYMWQKQFFENGAAAFERVSKSKQAQEIKKIKTLQDKLVNKNEVLSELMEEHIKLKKELGEL